MASHVMALLVAVAFLPCILMQETHEAFSGTEEKEEPPTLDTFATYEDMQRYFANRNLRSLRFIDNPTDDSYVQAFNQHNEQPATEMVNKRLKRAVSATKLAKLKTPTMLKFEMSDAVEPSDEVKEIIREHRSRELQHLVPTVTTVTAQSFEPKSADSDRGTNSKLVTTRNVSLIRKLRSRTKRNTNLQPVNFHVEFVPFEVTDAREPDEASKILIKRMRALELDHLVTKIPIRHHANQTTVGNTTLSKSSSSSLSTSSKFSSNTKIGRNHKRRRTRRSAPQTPPQLFKFELADAKEPDESIKLMLQQKHNRESKDLKKELNLLTNEQNGTNAKSAMRKADTNIDTKIADIKVSDDQSNLESKRYFSYKDAPSSLKAHKSINSLPQAVQKVISHLMKDGHGAKGYSKYTRSQPLDYGHFNPLYSAKFGPPVFGTKLLPTSYVNYVAPEPKPEKMQVQIHPVPVVEKVRYIYSPIMTNTEFMAKHTGQAYPHHSASISNPIELPAIAPYMAPEEIHHTYMADLTHVHNDDTIKDTLAQQLDPTLDENKLVDASKSDAVQHKSSLAVQPVKNYKYVVHTEEVPHGYAKPKIHLLSPHQQQEMDAEASAVSAPIIKIEYHAPPDGLKDNYKELEEFKELSTLMGKSPEDQIHGLTYLLAKEMQSRLQMQREKKQIESDAISQRPQDNTAPILFHPEQQQPQQQQTAVSTHAAAGVQSGKLIGMARVKDYIPIVESTVSEEQKSTSVNAIEHPANEHQITQQLAEQAPTKLEAKAPLSKSYIEYGLSQNYDGQQQQKLVVEQVAHHPTLRHYDLVSVDAHQTAKDTGEEAGVGSHGDSLKEHQHGVHYEMHRGDEQELQYASKYAFGYRIRDFHTGNDFGHKQNRDLDGVTRGQYHILLPDGRIQNVIYHADDTGFHADVSFESGH